MYSTHWQLKCSSPNGYYLRMIFLLSLWSRGQPLKCTVCPGTWFSWLMLSTMTFSWTVVIVENVLNTRKSLFSFHFGLGCQTQQLYVRHQCSITVPSWNSQSIWSPPKVKRTAQLKIPKEYNSQVGLTIIWQTNKALSINWNFPICIF